MLVLTRGLPIVRPLARIQFRIPDFWKFSLNLRSESTSLRYTNTSYAFPANPPSQIRPEQPGQIQATFLEEPTEEYGDLQDSEVLHDHVAPLPGVQASEVILRLITKGDLDGALAARDELVKLGIEIAQDRAFATAAIAELSTADPEMRSRKFIAWWSLVPLNECPEQLALACSKLMDHPFDIPLLMDFCIVCAKAGVIHSVVEQSRLFMHIFRYGNPNATAAFLLKLEHEAKKHVSDGSPIGWMSMRDLAIRMHLAAGRKEIARQMLNAASVDGFIIDRRIADSLKTDTSFNALPAEVITTKALYSSGAVKDRRRPLSELARELRILRQIVVSRAPPPHFEPFLAEFIDAYELHGRRSRAIRMLRKKVFKDSSNVVRARWIAGEQLAYSIRGRPIAVLRTYMNYCFADSVLAAEARPILAYWRKQRDTMRRYKDWKVSQKPEKVEWKIWPTNLSMSLAWKAILQLSKKRDVDRLYEHLLKHVEATRLSPTRLADELSRTTDMVVADKYYYDNSSHTVAVPPVVFPNAYFFHHFVVAYATRHAPRKGAQVLHDMQRLGLVPSYDSWGALAGAYARSGDFSRVLRILDHLDKDLLDSKSWKKKSKEEKRLAQKNWRTLLTTYNSVLRGFTNAAMYREARLIQNRMIEQGLFKRGVDKYTRAKLHRLSRYERGKFDPLLKRTQRSVIVDGRQIVVDDTRAEWLTELEISD
ncbi:uncharacterized protein FOMMEDRAFT_170592 [Fomitiporia mediterranea MF3/22]|uniref:uncharacterized protein n=1 Tax=Fomitiporia mediterranea (strain MF3/22) TaxID=694068 RepID=UPI00044099BC|nr:uncharacterized protein FOMMEDRAFT_170592 [Fomitiporia mediterranea MF3/22]EJC99283.1 hypothetical protein FOMMEDRAFT_170592 [Fomitiporia mediterranea MF3/22]